MTIQKFWPINGEADNLPKQPTQKEIKKALDIFKSLGKRKKDG